MTRVLYCSMETPLKSDNEVAEGAGRRVRVAMVSGRMVLVLVGRAVGIWTRGLGDSSRSDESRNPEILVRI